MIVGGIGGGVVVLAAQYWGKNETEPIKKIISVGMKFALLAGLVFFALSFFIPEKVLSLMTGDTRVIAVGVKYMRIMSVTNIIFAMSNTLVLSLRGVETAFIGTVTAATTMAVKAVLNYCLIFGNLGFPEMGIEGAAISTVIGWSVELVVVLAYMRFVDKKLKVTLRSIFSFDFTYLRDFFRTAFPVILSGSSWGLAIVTQSAILGHISETVIAANSISSVIYQVIAVLSLCSASAASVIIGKTIGENRMDMIKPYTITLQVLFVILGIISGATLFFIKDAIVSIYAVSEETRRMAVDFMMILSVTVIGTSYEFPVGGGIIFGGGDTKYGFYVDLIFLWGFSIQISALAAFVSSCRRHIRSSSSSQIS